MVLSAWTILRWVATVTVTYAETVEARTVRRWMETNPAERMRRTARNEFETRTEDHA